MSLDKMLDEIKDFSELKAFSDAQKKTILKLSKKNKDLEDEVADLKKQVASKAATVPATTVDASDLFSVSDQETICRMELSKLKQSSFERELTLEEAKRVDIYSKILNVIENNPKTIKVETKNTSNEDLINLIEDQSAQNE
jgi:cell division septum initiation protein DivIVA